MSKELINDQKKALVKRAEWLAANLKKDLESVDDYGETTLAVSNYIEKVSSEFGEYVSRVKAAEGNPGSPCPEGQVYCLSLEPRPGCVPPEKCPDLRE
ncbi:hypothetical protein KA005_52230 [bacterium]|nr:hypothetical protein [bacterium]